MSAQWFYAKGGDTLGPYSASDLRIMLEHGEIRTETLVWREGLDWVALGSRPELIGRVVQPPKPPKTQHTSSSPHGEPVEPRGRGTAREPRGTPALREPQGEGAGGVASQRERAGYVASQSKNARFRKEAKSGSPLLTSSPHPEALEGRGRGTAHGKTALARAKASIPEQTNNDAVRIYLKSAVPSAGPWARFFARLVDIMLLIAILFAELLAIQKLKAIMPEGEFIPLQMLALLSIFVLYYAITARFNSFGKAMIGIKTVPLNSLRRRLSFWQVVRREFGVYFYIITLGPPIGSIVNLVIAYLRVRRGESTRYDAGRYKVIDMTRHVGWRIPGAVVFAALCCGFSVSLLYAVEVAGTPWTNPQTGITVTLPKAWQQDMLGLPALRFTNVGNLTQANFTCTPRGTETLAGYEATLRAELERDGTWYATLGSNREDRQMAVGQIGDAATAALVEFGPAGDMFCNLVFIDLTGTKTHVTPSLALTEALFESAGAPE